MSISVVKRRELDNTQRKDRMLRLESSRRSEILARLMAFVPRCVVQQNEETHEHDTTVMILDISGFTTLAETYTLNGRNGISAFHCLINPIFEESLQILAGYGGDVIHFAGDALIVRWTYLSNEKQCLYAAQSSAQLHRMKLGHDLKMHIAIAHGYSHLHVMRGMNGMSSIILTGAMMPRLAQLDQYSSSGRTVCDQAVAENLVGCSLEPLEDHVYELKSVDAEAPFPVSCINQQHDLKPYKEVLMDFCPGCISIFNPVLSEMRLVSVIFMKIEGACLDGPTGLMTDNASKGSLATFLQMYEGLICVVESCGGYLRQFLIDDKGCVMIVAFGVPSYSYRDNAARAMECAARLLDAARSNECMGYAGVTTGRTFCGLIGSEQRQEYSIIGDVVNLAARLMVAAKHKDETAVLVSLLTWENYRIQRMHNETMQVGLSEQLLVKGRKHKVEVVRAQMLEDDGDQIEDQSQSTIGFETELAQIRSTVKRALLSVEEAATDFENQTIVCIGKEGYGKTQFLKQVLFDHHSNDQIQTVFIRAHLRTSNHSEMSSDMVFFQRLFRRICTNGHPWHDSIIHHLGMQLLDLSGPTSDITARNMALQRLLGHVQTNVKFDSTWSALKEETIVEVLRDLQTMRRTNQTHNIPFLILIDDAHFIDLASWEMLIAWCATATTPLIFVCTSTPHQGQHLTWFVDQFTNKYHGCFQTLYLQPLDEAGVARLVQMSFPERFWNEDVCEFIASESCGVPFLVKEIASVLHDSTDVMKPIDLSDVRSVSLSVENAVTMRVDSLDPSSRFLLKCASLLGAVFDVSLLREMMRSIRKQRRMSYDHDEMNASLLTLVQRDYLSITDREGFYQFNHESVRIVIYNLVSPDEAKIHHAHIAYFIESHFQDLRPHFKTLIWHYIQCGDFKRAKLYAVHSLRHKVQQGNITEAVLVAEDVMAYPLTLSDFRELRQVVSECIAREHRHLARLIDTITQRSLRKSKFKEATDTLIVNRRRSSLNTTNALYGLLSRIDIKIVKMEHEHMIECSVPPRLVDRCSSFQCTVS